MTKEKILIIAEKNQLGLLAKWAKQETGLETKRFNITKGFPNGNEISDIENIFILLPTTINKEDSKEFLFYTSPHIEKFFYDKNLWFDFNFSERPIEKLEYKIRGIFKMHFKKKEETFSSSISASS